MKKLLTLLLVAALMLSLAACGGGNDTPSNDTNTSQNTETPSGGESTPTGETEMTKEEMLEQAIEIDDYRKEMEDNIARAEAKYVGNIYYVTDYVSDISSDHLKVGDFTVYLPTEDIVKVSAGQKITVVGKIDSIAYDVDIEMAALGYFEPYSGVMSNAYFVNDVYEITGTLTFYYMKLLDIDGRNINRDGNPEAWVIGLDMSDDNVTEVNYHMEESIPVNHVSGQNITSVQFGGQELTNKTKITVSGKVFKEDGYIIRDAELISVG